MLKKEQYFVIEVFSDGDWNPHIDPITSTQTHYTVVSLANDEAKAINERGQSSRVISRYIETSSYVVMEYKN